MTGTSLDETGRASGAENADLSDGADARTGAVLRQWLLSLATDAEAALAAAIAYRDMSGAGRDQWLRDLCGEVEQVDVPRIAVFAPLLAVEEDPERRASLLTFLGSDRSLAEMQQGRQSALVGRCAEGGRIYLLAAPLYLDFVQVLACKVSRGCFQWVRHDPILAKERVPLPGARVDGVPLEIIPVKVALDELAEAVLSHQRSGEELPEGLSVLADLLHAVSP